MLIWLATFLLGPLIVCAAWLWTKFLLSQAEFFRGQFHYAFLLIPIAGLIYISAREYLAPQWSDFQQALRERLEGWGSYVSPLLLLPGSLGFFLGQLTGASVGTDQFLFQSTTATADVGIKRTKHPEILEWFLGAGFALLTGSWIAGGILGWEWNKTKIRSWNFPGSLFLAWSTIQTRNILTISTGIDLDPIFKFPFHHVELGFWRGILILISFSILIPLIYRFHFSFFSLTKERLKNPWPRMGLLTIVIALLSLVPGTDKFYGPGNDILEIIFIGQNPGTMPIQKLLFTTLAIAAGFIGGTFLPFVVIGAGLGAVLSHNMGLEIWPWITVGCFSLYGYAERLPWTCAFLAFYFFGFGPGLVTLIVCMGNPKNLGFIKFQTIRR